MTATAGKAVTAESETLNPASSRVPPLVDDQHQTNLLLPAVGPLQTSYDQAYLLLMSVC